jgi:autoinducer 2-degrading protein
MRRRARPSSTAAADEPTLRSAMHVTLVHVHVKPEVADEFIDATVANCEASMREPGNVRFDLLRDAEDPTRFIVYEAYVDEAAGREHKDTPHYLEWRERVEDWMAEPRRGVRYDGLFPETPPP